MSRIGRAPITVPPGVTVDVGENNHVVVKGPRGTLEQDLPAEMNIVREDGTLRVERPTEAKQHKALHGLTRSLLSLRKNCAELRRGSHYFHNDYERYLSRGILLFQRENSGAISLIAINFTNIEQRVPFVFSRAGNYTEQLHNEDNFIVSEGETRWLTIPSNYGRVWRNG